MLIAAAVLTVAALVAGVATFTADNHTPAAAAPTQTVADTATSPSASASSEAEPDDPGTLAMQILNRGTAALLKGDEAGWLAIVDPSKPKLRAYYRDLYTRRQRPVARDVADASSRLPPWMQAGRCADAPGS